MDGRIENHRLMDGEKIYIEDMCSEWGMNCQPSHPTAVHRFSMVLDCCSHPGSEVIEFSNTHNSIAVRTAHGLSDRSFHLQTGWVGVELRNLIVLGVWALEPKWPPHTSTSVLHKN